MGSCIVSANNINPKSETLLLFYAPLSVCQRRNICDKKYFYRHLAHWSLKSFSYICMRNLTVLTMITDKEYPATHSMSTAWFAIDTDGNVGILDFNENGPIPDGVPETAPDFVLMEMMSDNHDGIRSIPWTDSQVEEVLQRLSESELKSDTDLYFSAIVQIDTAQTDYFRKVFSSPSQKDYESCDFVCLSERYGLYYADFFGMSAKQKAALFQKGTILRYMDYDIDTEDHYNGEDEIYFEHNFDHFPIYLYQQPYWTENPMRRTYIPRYPLKESQLPERVREMALRLPFRFDDREELQIAEYFPFRIMETAAPVDGGDYYLLPTGNGKRAYIRDNSLPYVQCEETCNKCGFESSADGYRRCLHVQQFCERPTLAIIYGAHSCMEHEWMEHWPVLRHAAALPLTHENVERSYSRIGEYIRKKKHRDTFENCKVFLEEALQTISPYALILFKETKDKLAQYYSIEGDRITICGEEYPFFMYNEMPEVYGEVKSYAEKPYRGKIVNRIKEYVELPTDEHDAPDNE